MNSFVQNLPIVQEDVSDQSTSFQHMTMLWKMWWVHDLLQHDALSNVGDLWFCFSSSYHFLLYSLKSALAFVYNVYFFAEAVFSILKQLVGFYQWRDQIWRRNCPHCYLCAYGWYYTEIIQIVSLQEIFHRNITMNVAPILLLVFPLILGQIYHQFHREITNGKN